MLKGLKVIISKATKKLEQMSKAKKKKFVANRDFNSLGTKKSYKKGKPVVAEEKYLKEWENRELIVEDVKDLDKTDKGGTSQK